MNGVKGQACASLTAPINALTKVIRDTPTGEMYEEPEEVVIVGWKKSSS